MKIQKKTNNTERQILVALIVDKKVLATITSKHQKDLFRSKYANLIAGWCFDYFNRYEKPPGSHIANLFDKWAAQSKDKETVGIVEKFLGSVSNEYEELQKEMNGAFVLDLAGKYFNEVRLERLVASIQSDIDGSTSEKALHKVNQFTKIDIGKEESINVLQDKVAIQAAFEDRQEALISYPGSLGKFFRNELGRDSFISFMAPEKRGKTWWLLEIAFHAMLQRKRVAFFEVGDMSKNQTMSRFMTMAAGRPRYPKEISIPVYLKRKEDKNNPKIRFKTKTFSKGLSWQKAYLSCKKIMRLKIKSKHSYLRLSCHSASSIDVSGIKNILEDWQRIDGWTPDVIVIDYADLLAPDESKYDRRDQINNTWEKLRGLSQIYHCLVLTATQSDSASYDAKTLKKSNFSEDKRKLAHVTGMIGINQTDDEKGKGIMRLNWVVLRENEFSESKCIWVAGCLDIGRPVIKSCF
jgi:replicative DNA helicase